MAGTVHTLEVISTLPPALERLSDLAGNLLYSWDRNVRRLFHELDADLWQACRHNPTLVLRRIAQERLDMAAQNPQFLASYRDTLARFDAYMQAAAEGPLAESAPTVAYLCMEFGLHESVGIYSGGLGILAGDHCKAASGNHLPFVAVGLMYRQGYMTQRIDASGAQQSEVHLADPAQLPVRAVLDAEGQALKVAVPFPGRQVSARIWRADVGRVVLYLLDTDTPENALADRAITNRLYGGDRSTRIAQELVLGVGGVRALRAMSVPVDVWHINEGHPAFLIFERCRELIEQGLPFLAAVEQVAAGVVFTTHTPVPAGHDCFDAAMARQHLTPLAAEMGIAVEHLLVMGAGADNPHEFNMTALALRGSRHCNGVSAIHGRVASEMATYMWPHIDAEENPMQYVTNGVHVPTVMANAWTALLDSEQPNWNRSLSCSASFWKEWVGGLPDHRFLEIRRSLKSIMLNYVGDLLEAQYRRTHVSQARIERMRRTLRDTGPTALVLGFARRITAYKRPLLLFQYREWLARLVNDSERPVLLIFAGKAHPADHEGQEMIQVINALASEPPFLGKLFFVENYDMALGRILVSGVDVWLNTPDYPLEASGTSGQKAAINGVINLSVLDGWWAEGWQGDNGWAIVPHERSLSRERRDALEAETLLALIEDDVVPEYFARNASALPEAWIRRAKAAMISSLPQFNVDRMLSDYMQQLYRPAAAAAARLGAENGSQARELAEWKRRIARVWGHVQLRWLEQPSEAVRSGEPLSLRVAANLAGLDATDVQVECVIESNTTHALQTYLKPLSAGDALADGEQVFELSMVPPAEGPLHLRMRIFPSHPALSHRFETGYMSWLMA